MRLGVSMPVLEFLAEILLRGMVIIKHLLVIYVRADAEIRLKLKLTNGVRE